MGMLAHFELWNSGNFCFRKVLWRQTWEIPMSLKLNASVQSEIRLGQTQKFLSLLRISIVAGGLGCAQ